MLHRNMRGQLHCDGGMAVKYPDGWGVYALNGVRMKAEHVETPAEKLDGRAVLAESNVEVRRELMRKIGIERMLSHLPHKLLDAQDHYELLAVDLSAEAKGCRYLKMLNPSIGVWHMEGVANECKTVQHALNWRAGNIDKEWKPIEIT